MRRFPSFLLTAALIVILTQASQAQVSFDSTSSYEFGITTNNFIVAFGSEDDDNPFTSSLEERGNATGMNGGMFNSNAANPPGLLGNSDERIGHTTFANGLAQATLFDDAFVSASYTGNSILSVTNPLTTEATVNLIGSYELNSQVSSGEDFPSFGNAISSFSISDLNGVEIFSRSLNAETGNSFDVLTDTNTFDIPLTIPGQTNVMFRVSATSSGSADSRISAVPEPGSAGMLVCVAVCAICKRRRRS